MKQKVIQVGHSKVVVVPAAFVKMVGIHAGDEVQVAAAAEKGQLVYTFHGVRQLRLPQ